MRYRLPALAFATLSMLTSTPAAACLVPQIFYFSSGSAEITERSEQSLATLAAWILRRGSGLREINIDGYSDRTGSRAARMAISRARARAIRDWLVSTGIPATRIFVHGRSDSVLLVDTPDGIAETDNRRAEVYITLTDAGEEALRQSAATRTAGGFPSCG